MSFFPASNRLFHFSPLFQLSCDSVAVTHHRKSLRQGQFLHLEGQGNDFFFFTLHEYFGGKNKTKHFLFVNQVKYDFFFLWQCFKFIRNSELVVMFFLRNLFTLHRDI